MDDQVIARLIRIADEGPAIPADGAARIKEAIRPLWMHETRARRYRVIAWSGSAIAAAVAIVAGLSVLPSHQPAPPVTPQTVGTVELVRGAFAMSAGNGIRAGVWIATDAQSRVAIRLAGGQSLRIDANSRARIVRPSAIELDRGALYVDSGAAQSGVEVHAGAVSIRDLGTQFEVRRDDELRISVRRGAVRVGRVLVGEGQAAVVERDGSVRAARPPDWRWIERVSPPFLIEGQSVDALLAWVSSESGLRIRYESAEAERLARTTILHGRLGDVLARDAAETILPTAGLTARRARDALIVGLSR